MTISRDESFDCFYVQSFFRFVSTFCPFLPPQICYILLGRSLTTKTDYVNHKMLFDLQTNFIHAVLTSLNSSKKIFMSVSRAFLEKSFVANKFRLEKSLSVNVVFNWKDLKGKGFRSINIQIQLEM